MKYHGSKEEWQDAYKKETKICGKEAAKIFGYAALAGISIWQMTRHAFNAGSHDVCGAIAKDAFDKSESCLEEE